MSKVVLAELVTWESMYWPEGVPRFIDVPEASLCDLMIRRWARKNPEKKAVIFDAYTLSYSELEESVGRVAGQIRTDSGGSRHIMMRSLSSPYSLILLLGALWAGAKVFELAEGVDAASTSAREGLLFNEGGESAEASSFTYVDSSIIEDWMQRGEETLEPREDGEISLCVQGKRRTEYIRYVPRLLMDDIYSFNAFLGIGEDTVSLQTLPLQELGLFHPLSTLLAGGSILWAVGKKMVDIAETLSRAHPNYLADTGSIVEEVAGMHLSGSVKRAMRDVRWFILDSSKTPLGLMRRCEDAAHVSILRAHLIPGVGLALSNHPSWRMLDSIGMAVTNLEARVLSPYGEAQGPGLRGELAVKGSMVGDEPRAPNQSIGFVHISTGRDDPGWLRTGETVTMDGNGLFYPVAK